jgi:hypothetical protein
MRRLLYSTIISAFAVWSATVANATEWRTQAFELRLDRLYFPAGEEALIFEGAPFTVINGADTIYSGLIDHAWEGVSVSASTHGFFDTIPTVRLDAILTQAEIDTTRPVSVGNELSRLQIRAESAGDHRVDWSDYTPIDPLREDFLSGSLDAIVTLTDFDPHPDNVTTASAPLPYIVVLIPNVRREFNYHGELTTSLFYRFNARQLAVCFRGDEANEVRRFTPSGPNLFPLPRWYDFDPARGKKLFDRINRKPSRLKLHSGHPSLDGLARYFADILSRDRCVVELTGDRASADIRLEYVPFQDSSPRAAFDSLIGLLAQDSVKGSSPAEYLRKVDLELRGLNIALQPADSVRHLEALDRIMAEDLGVFPLFRPTLYLHTQKRLRGVTLTPDGRVDFSSAVKIRLPHDSAGGSR